MSRSTKAVAAAATILSLAGCGGSPAQDAGGDRADAGAAGGGASPEVLASAGSSDPSAIAVDAHSVYWTGSPGILTAPKSGGTATTLAATRAPPSGIAVDAAFVYYAADGSILKVPVGGGTPVTLATGVMTNALAVDPTGVYWADSLGSIEKVPAGGGSPANVSGSSGSYAYPARVAIDATTAYWVDSPGVSKAPLTGGAATTLSMAPTSLTSLIAVQAAEVYFTEALGDGGAVSAIAASGGTLRQLAVGQFPSGLAADDFNVYWADRSRGTVEYVPRSGGPSTPLATGEDRPGAIALDAAYVYWVDLSGRVSRVRKP